MVLFPHFAVAASNPMEMNKNVNVEMSTFGRLFKCGICFIQRLPYFFFKCLLVGFWFLHLYTFVGLVSLFGICCCYFRFIFIEANVNLHICMGNDWLFHCFIGIICLVVFFFFCTIFFSLGRMLLPMNASKAINKHIHVRCLLRRRDAVK